MLRGLVVAVISVLVLASSARVDAVERLTRLHDRDDGLPASVNAFAQDHRGHIWVGSEVGLTRYDGRVFEPWAVDHINELVHWIAPGPNDRVVVIVRAKGVWEVIGRSVVPLLGPDGAQLRNVHRAGFGADGALWLSREGRVQRLAPDGRWGPLIELPGDYPYSFAIDRAGDAFVGGGRALWRVGAGGEVERLVDVPAAVSSIIALAGGGCAFTATVSGKAFTYRDGDLELIAERPARAVSVVERRGRLWISWDKHLGYVDPGRPAVIDHLRDGGELLVDREGSLWMGTFHGLEQFPEPDTVVWAGREDGLASSHVRAVAPGPEGMWFNAWSAGPYLLDLERGAVRTMDGDWHTFSSGTLCTDGDGAVWGAGRGGLAARRDGQWVRYPLDGVVFADRCSVAPDGRIWFATDAGLFVAGLGDAPRGVTPLPSKRLQAVYEDRRGGLWIGWDERVCHGEAAAARRGEDPTWRCEDIAGSVHPTDFAETEAGTLWLGTRQAGLWYRGDDAWRPVPSARVLAGRDVRSIATSPRGGLWIATAAAITRVQEGGSPSAPWVVLEELGPWNGLMRPGAGVVHEAGDGTVWVTNSAGLTRVPPLARDQRRPPPRVSLVAVRSDGRPVDPAAAIELPYGDHQLELEFSGPTFRDPTLLRYRMRLGAGNPWSAPTRLPIFNLVSLAPGRYRVEVAASLDGRTWSALTAEYAFDVARPWWMRPWVWLLGAMSVLGVGFAVHRARLLVALRLERQRTRIAADLHDEMGSGLGSIGLLAGVAAQDAGPASKVADTIADTAAELGDALTDIVWSLRPGSGAPAELAAYLTRKGETLFPGANTDFTTRFPERWPRVELSLPVRRNLQLIATEALHNAARHASAARVALGIDATGKRWWLWVEDDGVGIDPAASPHGTGLGTPNMRRRAREIGATLEIGAALASPSGTRVAVRFDPRARDRRIP